MLVSVSVKDEATYQGARGAVHSTGISLAINVFRSVHSISLAINVFRAVVKWEPPSRGALLDGRAMPTKRE